jgi:hypothetical protein
VSLVEQARFPLVCRALPQFSWIWPRHCDGGDERTKPEFSVFPPSEKLKVGKRFRDPDIVWQHIATQELHAENPTDIPGPFF